MGALLRKAKAQVKHGEWTPYVEKQCGFGVRQAQNYMSASNANHRGAYLDAKKEGMAKHRAKQKERMTVEEAQERMKDIPGAGMSDGEWIPWVKKHCGFSRFQANEYMKVRNVDDRHLHLESDKAAHAKHRASRRKRGRVVPF